MTSEFNIPLSDRLLYAFIAGNTKVLFVRPRGRRALKYLIETKNIDLYVLDKRDDVGEIVERAGGTFLFGDIQNRVPAMSPLEFDIAVLDEVILSYTNPLLILQHITRVARYAVITINNVATLSKRLQFLFTGRLVGRLDNEKWYEKSTFYTCSIAEFGELCVDAGMSIERACYYDSKQSRQNLYDLRRMPSFFAEKFYFVVSANSVVSDITPHDSEYIE